MRNAPDRRRSGRRGSRILARRDDLHGRMRRLPAPRSEPDPMQRERKGDRVETQEEPETGLFDERLGIDVEVPRRARAEEREHGAGRRRRRAIDEFADRCGGRAPPVRDHRAREPCPRARCSSGSVMPIRPREPLQRSRPALPHACSPLSGRALGDRRRTRVRFRRRSAGRARSPRESHAAGALSTGRASPDFPLRTSNACDPGV
jgi:hypothetical protein